jgi:hypothetical protein
MGGRANTMVMICMEVHMRRSTIIAALIAIFSLGTVAGSLWAAGTGIETWGARAAAADADLSVEDMLRYAIQDEYLARAEYAAIIKKFGSFNPFANIIRAEESHVSWLVDAYKGARLAVPEDRAASLVAAPESQKAAFEAGIEAEIANIAMYDSFLASPFMAKSENSSLKALFTRLRDASKNHLAAFRNGLSKY